MRSHPVLGILYFDHDGLGEDAPFSDINTDRAYSLFSKFAFEKGLRVVLGRPEDYSGGTFAHAWDLLERTKVHDIRLDAAWDRSVMQLREQQLSMRDLLRDVAARMPIANHPDLVELTEDKYRLYTLLGNLMPKTFLGSELALARKALEGRVVTKPRYGSHGVDVEIRNISEVGALDDTHLIQEFVDSGAGIPGIIPGAHDVRVTMLNDTIVDTYVRYPETGLISNMSRGGKMKLLLPTDLPPMITKTAKDVDSHFSHLEPRYYSIDFMLDGERVYIIELNKSPGIWGHILAGVPMDRFERLCVDIVNAFLGSIASRSS